MTSCTLCQHSIKKLKNDYMQCDHCKTIFNGSAHSVEYEEDYFNKDYEIQYGKSYFDDRQNIKNKMAIRSKLLYQKFDKFENKRILEIGSAAGFCLEEFQNLGNEVMGWEISTTMSNYANENGISTKQGNFFELAQEHIASSSQPFDVISAFYVIEHFKDQQKLFLLLNKLLKKNGILLLALPSTFGPTFHFNYDHWHKTHPEDHYVDYAPKPLETMCSNFGFKFVCSQPESFHASRFPLGKIRPLAAVYKFISSKMTFADTFFVILQKTKNL